MNWLRFIPLGLLLMAACAGFPFQGKAPPASDEVPEAEKVPGRVQLELQNIHYDGESLSARLLIGVTEGQLRLDKRLFADIDVEIRSLADCRTGFGVSRIIADAFPGRGKEDLLILKPGYWYGEEIRFLPFDEHLTGLGPECLKAELWLFSFDGRIAAHTEIRAERPPRPSDAGVPVTPEDDGGVEVHFTEPRVGP